jgi:hypothetical protein
LRTSKRSNFEKFASVIALMDKRRHLSIDGLIEIGEIVQTMNFKKPSELLRILRDHTPAPSLFPEERMRWSGPCGDVGRLTETISPPLE